MTFKAELENVPDIWRQEIRRVLMQDWDPIGISDEPNAADEYDIYIPRVYELLTANESVETIGHYLFCVVDQRMGMSPPAQPAHMRPAAEALKKLFVTRF